MAQQKKWKNFENSIKKTNYQYRKNKLAVIEYIEVPIKGNVLKQSTVDFFGAYGPNGKGIAFDAKQTGETTSFPLSNMKQHQVEFLRYWDLVGADSYIFIQFYNLQGYEEFFMTPAKLIVKYWDNRKNSRKSIPISEFKDSWRRETSDYLNILKNNESNNIN